MNASAPSELPPTIPVSVITGFLGSGKTTLLSKLLRSPALSDAAVIINEFGEIGLDHQLVAASSDDIVLMSSGCLCCTIRGDLVNTLCSLFARRERGEVPRFRRVVIETTGLADPAPILHTLMDDSLVRSNYSLDGVITAVDALFGAQELDEHIESVKQVAMADRLVLTKTDLVDAPRVASLRSRILKLNPGATVLIADCGRIEPNELLDLGLYDPITKNAQIARWLRAQAYGPPPDGLHDHDHADPRSGNGHNRHDARIQAQCLVYDAPLDWRYFSPNLASLISRHAEKLLRVKGILNVAGEPGPVVVHGVQHQFQRLRLRAWPDDDRSSKLVLITRDLDRAFLAQWLQAHRLSGEQR